MGTQARVTSDSEVAERLATLPEFSRSVYAAIKAGLYAEPGFSDVTVADVAERLGCAPLAVNAAVGRLIEAGLVNTEEYERKTMRGARTVTDIFLHTYEHDRYQD
jgi:DNA-binding MarR family transcriptional regulator